SFRLLKLRVAIAFAIGALLAIDLISAAIHVGVDPKAAFYLTHFRAWELGVGALLALLPALSSRLLAEIIRAVGLALIACSYFFVTDKEPFPGINAAYACAGAALLIWPSSPTTLISRFLSIRPAVTIGLISYSLYLWHWPL